MLKSPIMNRPLPPIPVTPRDSSNSRQQQQLEPQPHQTQQPRFSNFARRITVPPPPPIDPPPPPTVPSGGDRPTPRISSVDRSNLTVSTCSPAGVSSDLFASPSQGKPRPRVPRMGTSVPISLANNSSPAPFAGGGTPGRRMLSPDDVNAINDTSGCKLLRRLSDGVQQLQAKTSGGQPFFVPIKDIQKASNTPKSDDATLKLDQVINKNTSLLPSLRLHGVSTASNICKLFRRNRLSVKSGRLTPISERTNDSSSHVNRRSSQASIERSETSSECSDATETTNLSFTWPLSRSHGEIYRSLSTSTVDEVAKSSRRGQLLSASSVAKSGHPKKPEKSSTDSAKGQQDENEGEGIRGSLPNTNTRSLDNPTVSSSLPNALELWTGSIDSEEVLRRFKRMRMITLTARRWTMKRRPDGTRYLAYRRHQSASAQPSPNSEAQIGKPAAPSPPDDHNRSQLHSCSRTPEKTVDPSATADNSPHSQSSSSNSSASFQNQTPGLRHHKEGHRSSFGRKKSTSPLADVGAVKTKSSLTARLSSLAQRRLQPYSKLCPCDDSRPSGRRVSEQLTSTRCSRVPHRRSLSGRSSQCGCGASDTGEGHHGHHHHNHHHHADFHLRCLFTDRPCERCSPLGVGAGSSARRRCCTLDGKQRQQMVIGDPVVGNSATRGTCDPNGTKLVTMLVV